MAFSVSMVRPGTMEGSECSEVALEVDAQDLVIFQFDTAAEAAQAGNELRAAVVSARNIILVNSH